MHSGDIENLRAYLEQVDHEYDEATYESDKLWEKRESLLARYNKAVKQFNEVGETAGPHSYRKLPVVIQAMQFVATDHAPDAVAIWCGGTLQLASGEQPHLLIDTLEGTMMANVNDYIIQGVSGEFYPCKPDIFLKTYERMF